MEKKTNTSVETTPTFVEETKEPTFVDKYTKSSCDTSECNHVVAVEIKGNRAVTYCSKCGKILDMKADHLTLASSTEIFFD